MSISEKIKKLEAKLAKTEKPEAKKKLEEDLVNLNEDLKKGKEILVQKIKEVSTKGALESLVDDVQDLYGSGAIPEDVQAHLDAKSAELSAAPATPATEGWVPVTLEDVRQAEANGKLVGFNPGNMTAKIAQ